MASNLTQNGSDIEGVIIPQTSKSLVPVDMRKVDHPIWPIEHKLFSWGSNTDGRLALGDITHRSSPVQVGSLTSWDNISSGCVTKHSVAHRNDGTIWSWGFNGHGQLGLGDLTYRSSPVQIGSLTSWRTIATGTLHSMAIKTDGTLWAWGITDMDPLEPINPEPVPVVQFKLGVIQTIKKFHVGNMGHFLLKQTEHYGHGEKIQPESWGLDHSPRQLVQFKLAR